MKLYLLTVLQSDIGRLHPPGKGQLFLKPMEKPSHAEG